MATLDLSFNAVNIPTNTSANAIIYEDVGDDGGANSDSHAGTTVSYDNKDTIALSDGVTSYTSADVFDESSGNSYQLVIEPDNTDVVSAADITESPTLTVETALTLSASVGNVNSLGQEGTVTGAGTATLNAGGNFGLNFGGIGTTDQVTFGTDLSDPQQFSISFWARPSALDVDSNNNYRQVIHAGGNFIIFEQVGEVSFRVPGVDTTNFRGGSFSVGDLIHVVCTYDQSDRVIYLNGSEVAQETIGSGTVDFGNFSLGSGTSSHTPAGVLDDFRVYDRAISAGDVTALYQGKPVSGGLLLHTSMDSPQASGLVDTAGSNNGTISGPEYINGISKYPPTTLSSGQEGTIAGTGAATLSASTGLVNSRGQEGTITGAGTATLTAATGQVQSLGQEAIINTPLLLAGSVGTTNSKGQEATLTTPVWMIDGWPLKANDSVNLSPKSVSLSFDSTDANISHWRSYDHTGDYTENQYFGGGWTLVDDQGRSSQADVTPPPDMQPPFDSVSGYVQSYNEQQLSTAWFGVDMTIARKNERQDVYSAPSESGEEWTLTLSHGTISLDELQVSRLGTRGASGGPQYNISLMATDTQAASIIDSAGTPNAVQSRSAGDAEDYRIDTSSNDRQTVTVSGPSNAALPDGDYLISGWQLSKPAYGDEPWRIDMTLVE